MSDDAVTDATTPGVSRRALMRTAAWSAPVIALTVATPLAAASEPVPPASVPTTFIVGTITATQSTTERIGTYTNGSVVFNSAGEQETTGNLYIEFTSTGPFTISYDLAAFQSAGWTLVSDTGASVTFLGASLSNGQSRSIPSVSWTGSRTARGTLVADVYADNPDVAGVGTTARFS